MEYVILGAKLVDSTFVSHKSLLVRDGKIAAIGDFPAYTGAVLDAKGRTVMPAFVDLHVHLRDPGFTQKEDIETASLAAAAGGFCAVNAMANTNPVCSGMDTVRYVREQAEKIGLIEVHQSVSVTENFDGKTLSHLEHLGDEVKLLSEDGKGVMSNHVFLQALKKAKENGRVILSHAEDMDISPYDYRLAENIATMQHIALAMAADAPLHLCHVSTKEAMQQIIRAKKRGGKITCEVAPHHIWFADCDYRVNPPIRAKEDVQFLIGAILRGEVDAIATDHAPHTEADKQGGAPGMVGLETAFAVCYTKLVQEHSLPLSDLSKLLAENPAKMLGLKKGRLLPGYDADLVLVDEQKSWTVDPQKFYSKSKNTPFAGAKLTGKVVRTIKGGTTTYQEED